MKSDQDKIREEQRIVRKAQAGDQAAIRALIELHKDRLFAFISRMVHNHHDAEEICQEAFLKAFANLASYSSDYRFSTWLFTIGYRVCLNSLRKKKGNVEFDLTLVDSAREDDPHTELQSAEASRLRETVWTAVDQLTPPQRATVLLFYRHEHSCQEVAQVLQVPVATVKSHLHRARARLRDILDAVSMEELHGFRNFSERAV